MTEKKCEISIYCKISTDIWVDDLTGDEATGDQIYEFLLKDAGLVYTEDSKKIPGDINLWYLGCNEKFGDITLSVDGHDYQWIWSFGESSFDEVKEFIDILTFHELIDDKQYEVLLNKIEEGRQIDNEFEITNYLLAKQNNKPFKKSNVDFRTNIKNMMGDVKKYFKKKGYNIKISNEKD